MHTVRTHRRAPVGVILFLVAALAVAIGVAADHGLPKVGTDQSGDDDVSVVVEWEPSPRRDPVRIWVYVDNGPANPQDLRLSPMAWRFDWHPGLRLHVVALQVANGDLKCAVTKRGKPVDRDARGDVGIIECYYPAPRD